MIHEEWGIRAIQGVFLLGTVWFAFAMLRRLFGLLPALFALAVFLAYFSRFAPPGNYTEQFGLLFQFLTLYLFIRSEEDPKPVPSRPQFALLPFGIGALGAASFLLRPNLVGLWIVIGVYWLVVRGKSLRKLATAVVGGGSLLILTGGLFVSIGAWSALWDAVFVFNFAHSDASMQERVEVVTRLVTLMFPISLLVFAGWCLGALYLMRGRHRGQRFERILLLATILLPLELVSLSLSGYGFRHYYITALPTIAILLAFLAWIVIKQRLLAPSLLAGILLLGAAYLSSPHSNIVRLAGKYTAEGFVTEDKSKNLAERARLLGIVQQSTEPDDSILVWGKGAWIYLGSDRDAPTRFFYEVPLTKPHYTSQSIRDEFLSEVMEEMPELIIDLRSARVPPLASEARLDWLPRHRFSHNLDDFVPFFTLVETHYLTVDVGPVFTIYVLRDNDAKMKPPVGGELIIQSTFDVYLNGRTLSFVKSQCTHDDAVKRFILHVFPVDRNVIDGNEQANLDFSFLEGKTWQVGEGCLVSQELPDYPIAAIRTGQYNSARTGHEWIGEYQFSESN